jgi:hypothetical protein
LLRVSDGESYLSVLFIVLSRALLASSFAVGVLRGAACVFFEIVFATGSRFLSGGIGKLEGTGIFRRAGVPFFLGVPAPFVTVKQGNCVPFRNFLRALLVVGCCSPSYGGASGDTCLANQLSCITCSSAFIRLRLADDGKAAGGCTLLLAGVCGSGCVVTISDANLTRG